MALYSREKDNLTQHTDGFEKGFDPNDIYYELSEEQEEENVPAPLSSEPEDEYSENNDQEFDQELEDNVDEGFAVKKHKSSYWSMIKSMMGKLGYFLFFLLLGLFVLYLNFGRRGGFADTISLSSGF